MNTVTINKYKSNSPTSPIIQPKTFIARDWRSFERNSLLGFFNLVLPSQMVVRDVQLHQRDGNRWVGLPAKPFQKSDGSTVYISILDFESKQAKARFQQLAIAAVDELLTRERVA